LDYPTLDPGEPQNRFTVLLGVSNVAKTKPVRSHKGRAEKLQALAREKFEGLTAGEAVKKAGVSNATYHRWKNALWGEVTEESLAGSSGSSGKTNGAKGKAAAAATNGAGNASKKKGAANAPVSASPTNGAPKTPLSLKERVAQLEAENLQLRLTIADMAVEARQHAEG